MKTNTTTLAEFESTYALLLRSEEKQRTASETMAYVLLILSAVFSIWQIAHQPFTVPTNLIHSVSASQTVSASQPAV